MQDAGKFRMSRVLGSCIASRSPDSCCCTAGIQVTHTLDLRRGLDANGGLVADSGYVLYCCVGITVDGLRPSSKGVVFHNVVIVFGLVKNVIPAFP